MSKKINFKLRGKLMKNMIKNLILLVAFVGPHLAFAQVDIEQKMNVMKENVDNSTHNFDRNKENMDTSAENVKELSRVLNDLSKYKLQGEKDLKVANDNIVELAKAKQTYEGFIKEEADFISLEQQNIEKLKDLTRKVLTNIDQRKKNILAYQNFVEKVDLKLKEWDVNQRKVASTLEMIDSKNQTTTNERNIWLDKTKLYKDEASNWAKQKKISEVNYDMFSKMRKK
jgi:uncharacterized phage infection (PIP) family protein YhgE